MQKRKKTKARGAKLRSEKLRRKITYFIVVVISVIILGYIYNKYLPDLQKPPAKIQVVTEKSKIGPCDVIHIGTVCVTQQSKLRLYMMLKSLFRFRKSSPIHFYIIVDPHLLYSLSKLFETWAVPEVKVNFYNVEDIDEYTNTPNMLRFMLPKLMKFEELNQIILLSTDILFSSDVFELWNEFQYFRENQFLGIPEKNMEDFQRGSADVVLYHLANLRKYGPDKVWKIIKERQEGLKYDENSQIQVLLTYFAKSKFAYLLECSYNAMRDPESDCIPEYKVVHQELIGKDLEGFVARMKEYDGNAVRKHNYDCFVLPKRKNYYKRPTTDQCSSFPESGFQQKRTLLYFYDYQYYSSDSSDVTLITQLSYDKFGLLEEIASRWDGPMSITFYLTDEEFIKCIGLIESSDVLKDRLNIGYHVVFKYGKYYHSNYLRNVALKAVETPYVFSIDVDLLPMENLYSVIKRHLTDDFHNMSNKALVIPAFEIGEPTDTVPSTMIMLLEMIQQKKIFILQEITNPEAQKPTDYGKWKYVIQPYKVTWKAKYEPYVVVKSNMVRYDERFFAYGWEQVSHIMELEAQGYEFYVLQNTFIVQKFNTSEDKNSSLISSEYKMCLNSIKEKTIKDLNDKYGRTFAIN